MKNNKHDHWRIPLASGLGGFIGTWITLLIPGLSIWMTMVALIVGAGVGWLVGYLSYDLQDIWKKSLAISKIDIFSPLKNINLSSPKITVENAIWTSLWSTIFIPALVLGLLSNSTDFGIIVLVVVLVGLIPGCILFGKVSLGKESDSDEFKHHIFEDYLCHAPHQQAISVKNGHVFWGHIIYTMIATMCKGLLWSIVALVALLIFALLAIPLWFYQLIKVISCHQRVASGFSGLVGTIIGFFFKSPHIGFASGAVIGWVGWYAINRLPGVSVNELVWQKLSLKIITKMGETIQTHLPPSAIPVLQ